MLIIPDTYEKRVTRLADLDPFHAYKCRETNAIFERLKCDHIMSDDTLKCIKCGKTQLEIHRTLTRHDDDYFVDVLLNGLVIERTRQHGKQI